MTSRRILAILWSIAMLLLMLWSWATYTGPYRLAAEWQLEHFGAYQEKLTLFGPLIVLLIPAGFIGGWGPLLPPARLSPEEARHNAFRNARVMAVLGLICLVAAAAAGGLGYRALHRPLRNAELILVTGTEEIPDADLVRITGIARTDLITGYRETIGGSSRTWTFVPLTSPSWRTGEPIRFLLKTNQTAWIPPPDSTERGGVHMLRQGAPPFRMTTEPSVMKQHVLPGIIQTQYEKGRVPLDPAARVIEQSVTEVYAPYWIAAALGGLMGVCLLLVALLVRINGARDVTASVRPPLQ